MKEGITEEIGEDGRITPKRMSAEGSRRKCIKLGNFLWDGINAHHIFCRIPGERNHTSAMASASGRVSGDTAAGCATVASRNRRSCSSTGARRGPRTEPPAASAASAPPGRTCSASAATVSSARLKLSCKHWKPFKGSS